MAKTASGELTRTRAGGSPPWPPSGPPPLRAAARDTGGRDTSRRDIAIRDTARAG